MKLHRFIGDFNFSGDSIVIIDAEIVKQIRSVLRLSVGDQIVLCNGQGQEALVVLESITKAEIKAVIQKVSDTETEPTKHVVLYCAVLKRENFEWVCQKATEIGVKEIVPVISKRTVKLHLNLERLQKIVKEAAEQSGRGVVPKLLQPQQFESLVSSNQLLGKNILFDASGDDLFTDNSRLITMPTAVGIWIGPEGGWDVTELEIAKNAGFQIATLGKLTLRAETAAIVAAYLAVS